LYNKLALPAKKEVSLKEQEAPQSLHWVAGGVTLIFSQNNSGIRQTHHALQGFLAC